MSRVAQLRSAKPELFADLLLFPRRPGGRRLPIRLGWGCPCCVTLSTNPVEGWDGYPLLGDHEMELGEFRQGVGFVFFAGQQAADLMRAAGKFYLWESVFIGEATVVG